MHNPSPQPVPLMTLRLHLRALKAEDAPALSAIMADPETLRYFNLAPFATLAACQAYVRALLLKQHQGQLVCWGIEQLDQRQLIGRIFLKNWRNDVPSAEVTYLLSRNAWGQGYMTEALTVVVAYCFEQTSLMCLEARCWKENQASARVLEKVGMRCEGPLPERYVAQGREHEVLLFRLQRTKSHGEKCMANR